MAEHLYGYGRWGAPYWFIGPEQGQAKDESDDLTLRARAWELAGNPEITDLAEYHDRIRPGMWTEEGAPIQRTWRKLMLIMRSYAGQAVDKESLRIYQRTHLGREHGETCLLELGGLAAHSSKIERDRTSYLRNRIALLQRKISEQEPLFVILYGKRQQHHYEVIAGHPLTLDQITWSGPTAILFTKHPNARKLCDQHWCNLGYRLSEALNAKTLDRLSRRSS